MGLMGGGCGCIGGGGGGGRIGIAIRSGMPGLRGFLDSHGFAVDGTAGD